MKSFVLLIIITAYSAIMSEDTFSQKKLNYNDVTKAEANVINNKATEYPGTGKYYKFKENCSLNKAG